jgi:quinoprotein glucose dehydrogenase
LKDAAGKLLMGDALLEDWRSRTVRGAARVRAYYDVHPSVDSALTLDPAKKNRWGDPLPVIRHVLDEATKSRAAATKAHILGVFDRMAKGNNGRVFNVSEGGYLDHPAGGCRMGNDPATSVCDSAGRTHDHENLFVVGAPTLPTGGCTNATLTFVALTLGSAPAVAKTL